MRQAWCLGPALDREMHLVGDLVGQVVKRQGRDEADDTPWHLEGDGHEVGLSKWGEFGQAVQAALDLLDDPLIAQPIERARMDAEAERLRRAKAGRVVTKQGNRSLVGRRRGDRLQDRKPSTCIYLKIILSEGRVHRRRHQPRHTARRRAP